MTAAERDELRRRISEARRAQIRHAPNAGARNPGLRRAPSPEEMEWQRANERAWKARERELVESLDDWRWMP